MAPLPLPQLIDKVEKEAQDAWNSLVGLSAYELGETTLETIHKRFVGLQRQLHEQLRGPTSSSTETDLAKLERRVADVIERINFFRTALKPVWAEQAKKSKSSSGAMRLGNIAALESRRTAFVKVLDDLEGAARQVSRAMENPPTTSPDPVGDVDDNIEAS